MCGIAAIFNYRTGKPINRPELLRLRDAMTPRGPDGCGEWLAADGRVGLGHRRLSIIDLSPAGAQPMKSADGALVVTFNGEIYNYKELRAELEAQGRRFQSSSDTEVLLHLYATEGEAMVQRLRGMFAFALWDDRKKGLFLARDPLGIKPLYLADDGQTLRVASQVKALLAGGQVDTSPEPAGHVGFFLWGHVPSPYTLYRGIVSLPAGTSLWLDCQGNRRENTFWDLTQILAAAEHAPRSADYQPSTINYHLSAALRDSVRHHLIADVPVGVFLSSGLDSTSLAALAAESSASLRTVTLGFEEFRGRPEDETPLAAQVATQCGARHETVWVSKQDFSDNCDRVLLAMDQPSCDGINSFFVSLAASRAGLKVALSGLGGDELFGGYPSFRELPRAVRTCQLFSFSAFQPFGKGFRLLSAPLLKRFTSPKYASLFEYGGSYPGAYLLRRGMFMPWELPELFDPDLVREGWQRLNTLSALDSTLCTLHSPFLRVGALEMAWYMRNQLLRDTDWAGMAHSIEIRTPLVDSKLLETLAPLLAEENPPTKRDMALAAFTAAPSGSTRLSTLDTLLHRPKTGFSVPVRDWLLDSQPATINYQLSSRDRGLRGWAKLVYSQFPGACPRSPHAPGSRLQAPRASGHQLSTINHQLPSRRILVLLSDGFGGHGGIAKFNRDLLTALCSHPEVAEVVALPRIMEAAPGPLPAKLTWNTTGLGGKLRYLQAILSLRHAPRSSAFDLVLCAHINLLPLAFLARRLAARNRAEESRGRLGRRSPAASGVSAFSFQLSALPPLVLMTHGIEAWTPRRSSLTNRLARRVDAFVSVSELTKQRFISWTGLAAERGRVLPNCVDASLFGPGPKNPALLDRYGLRDKTVLLTLGRLSSAERYKGLDEVLDLLPELGRRIPNLAYLVVGDGDDRPRLETKARSLGLVVPDRAPRSISAFQHFSVSAFPRVVFAGRIPDSEKADHYRLADAYVMPGWGEGFGIVYLEALACGIPVVASKADASREAVRNGELGVLVDPKAPKEIRDGILAALQRPRGLVPPGLDYFSTAQFTRRVHSLVKELVENGVPKLAALDMDGSGFRRTELHEALKTMP